MNLLESVLAKIAEAGFSVPIAWPGIDFTPPGSGQWLEVRLFESEPDSNGMANDSGSTDRGLLQISACARHGTGLIPVDTLAREVQSAFAKGTRLCDNIKVTRDPYRMGDVQAPGRLMIPVTIPYSA